MTSLLSSSRRRTMVLLSSTDSDGSTKKVEPESDVRWMIPGRRGSAAGLDVDGRVFRARDPLDLVADRVRAGRGGRGVQLDRDVDAATDRANLAVPVARWTLRVRVSRSMSGAGRAAMRLVQIEGGRTRGDGIPLRSSQTGTVGRRSEFVVY